MGKKKTQNAERGTRKKRGQKRPPKKRGGKTKGRWVWCGGVRPEDQSDEWAGLGLTPKQRALLAAYAACGSLRAAAKASGVARSNHDRGWIHDEAYAKAFREAKERASEFLEDEARRRAVEGVLEPVFYEGDVCGHKRRYSDTLLIFLLKGNNPEKFGDRLDATHRVPEPINVNVNLASEMLAQGKELMGKVLAAALKPGVPGVGGKG